MNKYLVLMWILIIGGGLFILQNNFKPQTPTGDTATNKTEKPEITIPEVSDADNLKLGDQYLALNYPAKAAKFYEAALAKEPESEILITKLTSAYLRSDQLPEAAALLQQSLKSNPDSTQLSLLTIRTQIAAGKIEEAKNTIITLNEKDPEVSYHKAIILILYKQFSQAEEALKKLDATNPNIKNLLSAFESHSYYRESEPEFLQLLLAKALVDNQEFHAAIPLLFDILNNKSNYRDAWITLGYTYLNISKFRESVDALSKARDLDPEKSETLFFLGLAYFANNQIDEAKITLQKAQKAGFEPKEMIDQKLQDLENNQDTQKLSREEQNTFYQNNLTTP